MLNVSQQKSDEEQGMGKLTGRVGELLKAEDFSGKIASTSIKRNVLHHQRLQISK